MKNVIEIKRKANVGERIRIVNAWDTYGRYGNGDTFVVDRTVGAGVEVDEVISNKIGNLSGYISDSEYVVLVEVAETNVVPPIDGRKAMVIRAGSRYSTYREFAKKYGYPEAAAESDYEDKRRVPVNGDKVTLLAGGPHLDHEGSGTLWIVEAANGERYIIGASGLKIEAKPLGYDLLTLQVEDLTETVAKLVAANHRLETQLKVAREDIVLVEEGVAADIDRLERAVGVGKYAKKTPVAAPLSREAIVERAKADVAKITADIYDGDGWGAYATPGHMVVDFVVNRDKRTVIALLKFRYSPSRVCVRGKSRCAPDDCFNVHLGKAIALRRALGLTVPDEYYNAPQPTEARVGDIVDEDYSFYRKNRVVEALRPSGYASADKGLTFVGGGWSHIDKCRVIDDSRTELESEVSAPSVSNPKPTDIVTATSGGGSLYLTAGQRYWVAEVDEESAHPYRLIKLGHGEKGGVWCARTAFQFGEETEEVSAA